MSTASTTGPDVFGPIGAAKSATHEAIVARITGANFFATQMHDAMKTDELFGQIDMPVYDREGRWVRNTTGYLPTAHLMIAEGERLHWSLLRVATKREWRNQDAELSLPLITMVAFANKVLTDLLAPVKGCLLGRPALMGVTGAPSGRSTCRRETGPQPSFSGRSRPGVQTWPRTIARAACFAMNVVLMLDVRHFVALALLPRLSVLAGGCHKNMSNYRVLDGPLGHTRHQLECGSAARAYPKIDSAARSAHHAGFGAGRPPGDDRGRTTQTNELALSVVRRWHVLGDALLPVSTTMGLRSWMRRSGAVLTEMASSVSGIRLFDTVAHLEHPVLQESTLFIAVVHALFSLVVGESHGFTKPRVRVS